MDFLCLGKDTISSAYYLVKHQKKHSFLEMIISQANEKTQFPLWQMKQKIYSFPLIPLLTTTVFLFFLLFSQKTIDHLYLTEKEKNIVQVSSFKIEENIKNINLTEAKESEKWNEIKQKWRNILNKDVSIEEIKQDLNFLEQSLASFKENATENFESPSNIENIVRREELIAALKNNKEHNAKTIQEEFQKELPKNIYKKIEEFVQSNKIEEAVDTYLDWKQQEHEQQQKTEKAALSDLKKVLKHLQASLGIANSNNSLSVSSNHNGNSSSAQQNNLEESIEIFSSLEETKNTRGWTQESWPKEYYQVIEKYMLEKEHYEKE